AAIWLARGKISERDEIGFRLEDQDGLAQVGANERWRWRADGRLRRLREWRPATATAVDQKTVVDPGQRMHRVHVGDETPGRLRLADGHHAARSQRPERRQPARMLDRFAGLRDQ